MTFFFSPSIEYIHNQLSQSKQWNDDLRFQHFCCDFLFLFQMNFQLDHISFVLIHVLSTPFKWNLYEEIDFKLNKIKLLSIKITDCGRTLTGIEREREREKSGARYANEEKKNTTHFIHAFVKAWKYSRREGNDLAFFFASLFFFLAARSSCTKYQLFVSISFDSYDRFINAIQHNVVI